MSKPKLSYAREQRFRFIDTMLLHYGTISRKILMDYFGIQGACATRDLQEYSEAYPDNCSYIVKAKQYAKAATFKRVYQ